MKALTIKNPFALLIAHGIKDIENRTWRTNFRGRIYIHCSAKPAGPEMGVLLTYHQAQSLGELFSKIEGNTWPNGCIIGEVDIVDCVINHPSIWAEQMSTYKCQETGLNILQKGQKYVWNWVLANPVLYEKPIENVKGARSFWDFDVIYLDINDFIGHE